MSLSFGARTSAMVLALAAVAYAPRAHADDPSPSKQECIDANENAQSLRTSHKLAEARTQLLVCIAKACPRPVREDCAQRLDEVETATPTIVIVAKGADGSDLTAVHVTMDGAPLVDRLDGSAIAVEPGEHTFELRTANGAIVTRKVVMHEGEKARNEPFTMTTAPAPPPPVVPPPVVAPPVVTPDEDTSSRGNGQRLLGVIVGGVGLAGVGVGAIFGLVANSTYHDAQLHCPTNDSCTPDGVAGGASARTQATISTVAFVAGGALVVGGVVLYLTAPKHGGVSVQTAASAGTVGLRLGGSF